MKVAYIEAVLNGTDFQWKWRSDDSKQRSAGAYAYYFECVQDAQKHGYDCRFLRGDSKIETSKTGNAA